MVMRKSAFTLTEVLVVTCIVAVLAALCFPAFASVKKASKMTKCISNLRQCAYGLNLYMEADDIYGLPRFEPARTALASAPTCDDSDYLRTGCTQEYGRPLIGSYAYIRGVSEQTDDLDRESDWQQYLALTPDPYVLASVFYGARNVVPFDGNENNPCVSDMSCGFPSRLVRVRLDSSVKVSNYPVYGGSPGSKSLLFTWGPVFDRF